LTALCAITEIARVELIREIPDVSLAGAFDGEPLVQSFRVGDGRAWITTREAMLVPGFGAQWVAGQLAALRATMDPRAFAALLREGLRLRAEVESLALAA
jgi:hypothetical protein